MATRNVCFVHIEKAGGTTLNDFFLEALRGYWILPPQKRDYGWRYDGSYLRRLRKVVPFQHVGGHQLAAFADYEQVFPNPLYVTFVREPLARFLSHVNWRNKQAAKADLDSILANSRHLNAQCFRIGGERTFAAARQVIESHPHFLGLTEHYAESVFILQKLLGLAPTPFENSNVTQARHRKLSEQGLTSGQWEQIREANAEDVRLYEWIVNDVFPRQQQQVHWSEAELQSYLQLAGAYRRGRLFDWTKRLKNGFSKLATRLIR